MTTPLEQLEPWHDIMASRNYSPRTIQEHLRDVAAFLTATGKDVSDLYGLSGPKLAAIVTAHLAWYRTTPSRYGKPPADATVRRRYAAILSWSRDTYMDISDLVQAPRVGKKKSRPLDADRQAALLAAARASEWPTRNELIVRLMMDCGLRRNEVAMLEDPWSFSNTYTQLVADGKGSGDGKQRVVPVPEPVRALLVRYHEEREARLTKWGVNVNGQLLITTHRYGHCRDRCDGYRDAKRIALAESVCPHCGGPVDVVVDLSYAGIGHVVTQLMRAAGVPSGGAHRLRHTYARKLSEVPGVTTRDIADLLGHEDIATTAGYLGVNSDAQRRGVEAAAAA